MLYNRSCKKVGLNIACHSAFIKRQIHCKAAASYNSARLRIFHKTRSLSVARIADRTGCHLKANMRLLISDQ